MKFLLILLSSLSLLSFSYPIRKLAINSINTCSFLNTTTPCNCITGYQNITYQLNPDYLWDSVSQSACQAIIPRHSQTIPCKDFSNCNCPPMTQQKFCDCKSGCSGKLFSYQTGQDSMGDTPSPIGVSKYDSKGMICANYLHITLDGPPFGWCDFGIITACQKDFNIYSSYDKCHAGNFTVENYSCAYGDVVGDINKDLEDLKIGIAHFFLQHTSASLTINENCDPDVRKDMEMALNQIVPETMPFVHIDEGPDDMSAHVKTSLLGSSLSIPITDGKLALGTWQGIWICEHRNVASPRKILITIQGE